MTKSGLAQRALDSGDSSPFSSIFLAASLSCSRTLSTPAAPPVTQTVFITLIKAAVYETNPSLNRYFVECASKSGYRRIAEALFEYIESGTNLEKEGAQSAFYWVIKFSELSDQEGNEALAFLETIIANQQYSDTTREHVNRFSAWMQQELNWAARRHQIEQRIKANDKI